MEQKYPDHVLKNMWAGQRWNHPCQKSLPPLQRQVYIYQGLLKWGFRGPASQLDSFWGEVERAAKILLEQGKLARYGYMYIPIEERKDAE